MSINTTTEYININNFRQNIMTISSNDSNPVLLIVHGGAGSPAGKVFAALKGKRKTKPKLAYIRTAQLFVVGIMRLILCSLTKG